MADNDQLSEEQKLREEILSVIREYEELLKERGISEKTIRKEIESYRDALNDVEGNSQGLKDLYNDLNIKAEGLSFSTNNYSSDLGNVLEQLNNVVESITNQSDLSNRINKTFKNIRQSANSIADDADLTYVRSVKYMKNQEQVLDVQEKRLQLQAQEGAKRLESVSIANKSRQLGFEMQEAQDDLNQAIREGNSEQATILNEKIAAIETDRKRNQLANDALDKAKQGVTLTNEEAAALQDEIGAQTQLTDLERRRILAAIEFNAETAEGIKAFKILQDQIQASIEREKELNKRMGITGALLGSFSKIPGFSSIFRSEDVEDVKNLAREALVEQTNLRNSAIDLSKQALEAEEAGNTALAERLKSQAASNNALADQVAMTGRGQIMAELLKRSFGNLKEVLTDPAAIFTFLVAKGLQFNSEVTDLSKNLGVTETQATKIRNEFTSISANTMDTAINTERLLAAQSELNKELNLGVQFSSDTLVNFVRLTEKIGLSAQQAAKLTLASASTGESATEFAGKSALAAAQQAKTLGITVNMKEIMEDTADLTNEQLILFGRQPEAIGKTLAEVKKLGIELGDLNAISSKLLDFQGSIESELEAELLTGKQLNLERARAAALAGDQATLAREIASQVGTISEFESMNVLQRQKLAESLGMNVNQLSGVLIRQEAINKGIADAKDLTDEQLAAAQKLKDTGQAETLAEAVFQIQEQRSAQDKFNDAVIKLQRLFGELLGGPVGELLDALVDVASVVIGPVASALNLILTPVKALTTLLTKVPNILKVIAAGLVALNFSGISASVGGIVTKIGDIGKGIGSLVSKAGDLGTKLVSGLSSGGEGLKGFFNGIKNSFTGVQDQAAGIEFDPRMAGGGRFRDMATGRMVSEEAANAAGVFKPGTNPTAAVADISPAMDDGSMLKEKMKNIAEGLKSFASMEVVKGALALTIASPGLFILSKAADGLNKLGEVKGEALQEAMKGIAEGVEKFGTVKVVLGSIGLLIASPGLVLLSMSVGGLKNLSDIGAEATQEAMGGLAEGIGEFGNANIIMGAIGLTIAAPGLLLLGASSLGLKAVESLNSEKIKESMASISDGVAEFGKGETLLGGLGLIAVAPGILTLAIASPGIAVIGAVGNLAEKGLKAVGRGIGFFGDNLVRMLKGSLALTALSVPIAAAAAAFSLLKGVDVGSMIGFSIALGVLGGAAALLGNILPQVLMGALALAAVGAAIIPAAAAFNLLGGVDIGAMFGFVGAITLLGGAAALLGNIAPLMLAGALGIAAVGIAIIPAAAAFSMLEGLDPTAMLGFAAALGILGATAAGLSLVGPAIIIGAAALTALSFALIPISKILAIASPGIQTFSNAIKELDPSQLLGLGAALPVLALGLTFFGASIGPIALASVGLLILGKALSPIAEMAPKLDLTSTSLKGIATSVALLATSLNTLDAAKLETLSDFEGNINISSVTASTTDQASAATNTTTNTANTVDQASVATNTVDQVNTTTSTINEPVSSLANLITKQNTLNNTEIVPGISVTTPPTTTTQETLTTNTENLSVATSNAATNLEKLNIATLNTLPPTTFPTTTPPTQLESNTNITEVAPINLEPPTEIVPGISVTTPNPENIPAPALERILTLTTEQINTAIGVLTTTTPTLDTLKAQAGLVDLRDGQQDIPIERFSDKSLEIVNAVINTVTKLGTNTELQKIGEKIAGSEISVTEGPGIKEEKVKLFKAQEPKTDPSIETPITTPSEGEKIGDSQVFIDNLQPLIAETVTATISAMLPPMVAALKEGQGKVKVVNDSFGASGQKGDINTIRRLPSDNFA